MRRGEVMERKRADAQWHVYLGRCYNAINQKIMFIPTDVFQCILFAQHKTTPDQPSENYLNQTIRQHMDGTIYWKRSHFGGLSATTVGCSDSFYRWFARNICIDHRQYNWKIFHSDYEVFEWIWPRLERELGGIVGKKVRKKSFEINVQKEFREKYSWRVY